MDMKVNVLGLSGAVVGVVAIFSTWLAGLFVDWNLLEVLNHVPHDELEYWSAVVVVVATIISFLTPTGSLLLIAGVAMWWSTADELPVNPGSYVAMASAIILNASMARPFGPGLMKGPFSLTNRLLTLSPGGLGQVDTAPRQVVQVPTGTQQFCAYCGSSIRPIDVWCPMCGRPVKGE